MSGSPTLVCPVCGTVNPATRQFCLKCASDLHAIVPAVDQVAAPAPTRVPLRPMVIGGGLALAAVIVILGLFVVLAASPAASPGPSSTPSGQPTPSAAVTEAPTVAATSEPTAAAPTPTAATSAASQAPGASPKPVVDSFSGPSSASCTGTNGTATAGYIHVSWSASNTTGVRLSIDPPAPDNAYNNGYDDYPAVGSADVPFTCDPPSSDATGRYHLYVVTTLHDGPRYAYRYIKVYLKG